MFKFRMGGYFVNLVSNINQKNIQAVEIPFESVDKHLLTGVRGTPTGIDNGNFLVETSTVAMYL